MAEAQDKATFLYNWLKECEKEHIILCFQGDFNQDLVNAILLLAERGPEVQNSSTVVRARVFSVLVECMQNIRKYGSPASSSDLKPGIVIVCMDGDGYLLKTGNFIENKDIANLKERLDTVIKLSKDELKDLHKKVLGETKLSEKSGAGLGLISIGRKSDGMGYVFKQIDDKTSFYALDVHISNTSK
jgi:hypothetical protein